MKKSCGCKGSCKGKGSCGCSESKNPRVSANVEKYLPKGEKKSLSITERMIMARKKKMGL